MSWFIAVFERIYYFFKKESWHLQKRCYNKKEEQKQKDEKFQMLQMCKKSIAKKAHITSISNVENFVAFASKDSFNHEDAKCSKEVVRR